MEHRDITQELLDERDLIGEWIDLIGEFARLPRGSFAEPPLAIHFPVIDEFVERYADRLHHAKQAGALFGVLGRAISYRGPIPVTLHERASGRAFRTGVGAAFRARDLSVLVEAGRDFGGLLAQHIAKENDAFYPIAEHCVPDEARLPNQEAHATAARGLGARALCERFERERHTLRANPLAAFSFNLDLHRSETDDREEWHGVGAAHDVKSIHKGNPWPRSRTCVFR